MAKSRKEKAQFKILAKTCRAARKTKKDAKSFWSCMKSEKNKLKTAAKK